MTVLKTSKSKQRDVRARQKKAAAKSALSRPSARSASASRSLAAEGRRSTAASLLKSAPGWCGEDLDDIVRIVTESRSKARF
jgi:hypothetical protein